MNSQRPKSTVDLRPSERRFLNAIRELGHGRFESLPIRDGELVLDPWPSTLRSVKFGNPTPNRPLSLPADFELKDRIAEFFAYVRTIEAGVIRVLEVRGGLPFCMDVTDRTQADHDGSPMFQSFKRRISYVCCENQGCASIITVKAVSTGERKAHPSKGTSGGET